MDYDLKEDEGKALSIKDLFFLAKKFFWHCVIITLIITILSGIAAILLAKPQYTAKSTVLVNYEYNDDLSSPANDRNALLYGLDLAETIRDFVAQKRVSDDVILKNNSLVDSNFSSNIKISANEGSLVISISYTTVSGKEEAIATVNEVVDSLIKTANLKDENGKAVFSVLADKLVLIDEANSATTSKKWPLYIIIGFVLGLVVSLCYLIVRHYIDDTIKTRIEIEELTGFKVVSTIEYVTEDCMKNTKSTKRVVNGGKN